MTDKPDNNASIDRIDHNHQRSEAHNRSNLSCSDSGGTFLP